MSFHIEKNLLLSDDRYLYQHNIDRHIISNYQKDLFHLFLTERAGYIIDCPSILFEILEKLIEEDEIDLFQMVILANKVPFHKVLKYIWLNRFMTSFNTKIYAKYEDLFNETFVMDTVCDDVIKYQFFVQGLITESTGNRWLFVRQISCNSYLQKGVLNFIFGYINFWRPCPSEMFRIVIQNAMLCSIKLPPNWVPANIYDRYSLEYLEYLGYVVGLEKDRDAIMRSPNVGELLTSKYFDQEQTQIVLTFDEVAYCDEKQFELLIKSGHVRLGENYSAPSNLNVDKMNLLLIKSYLDIPQANLFIRLCMNDMLNREYHFDDFDVETQLSFVKKIGTQYGIRYTTKYFARIPKLCIQNESIKTEMVKKGELAELHKVFPDLEISVTTQNKNRLLWKECPTISNCHAWMDLIDNHFGGLTEEELENLLTRPNYIRHIYRLLHKKGYISSRTKITSRHIIDEERRDQMNSYHLLAFYHEIGCDIYQDKRLIRYVCKGRTFIDERMICDKLKEQLLIDKNYQLLANIYESSHEYIEDDCDERLWKILMKEYEMKFEEYFFSANPNRLFPYVMRYGKRSVPRILSLSLNKENLAWLQEESRMVPPSDLKDISKPRYQKNIELLKRTHEEYNKRKICRRLQNRDRYECIWINMIKKGMYLSVVYFHEQVQPIENQKIIKFGFKCAVDNRRYRIARYLMTITKMMDVDVDVKTLFQLNCLGIEAEKCVALLKNENKCVICLEEDKEPMAYVKCDKCKNLLHIVCVREYGVTNPCPLCRNKNVNWTIGPDYRTGP